MIIDIILIFLFVLIVLRAGLRGFTHELTNAAAFILGLLFAFSFYKSLSLWLALKLPATSGTPYILDIFAFMLLFLICGFFIQITGRLLKDIIEGMGLEIFDKVLGFVFGVVKGFIIICFLIFIIRTQPITDGNEILKGSVLGRMFNFNVEYVKRGFEKSINV